jgi:hypothetical protein
MTIDEEIAQRHLLAVDGLEPLLRSEQQYVRIVVSERWASSHSGQFLTSCLVNLLCRQLKLVRHVEVVAPETRALIPLPNGDVVNNFPAGFQAVATWAVKEAVVVSTRQTEVVADHTIFVGDGPPELDPNCSHALLVSGDGWRAWVGEPIHPQRLILPTSANPLGPFLAAALAAGEIFKHGRGIRRGKFLSAAGYSLWSGDVSSDWDALEDGPKIAGSALLPVHVIGAGAVGNALAYIVASLGLSEGYFILIDDDKYDGTNLNRCLLAGWRDLGQHKVAAITDALHAGGIGAFPFVGVIKSYVADARAGLRTDVARQVDDLIFQIVVSCVDKGISRQDIHGLQPRLLLGGSTLDLQAKANLYAGQPGAACLACFNPAERDGEKIRAVEKQLRNMPETERSCFLTKNGLDVQAVEEYLSGARCGGLGETALMDFAIRPTSEFSAGFVSLGAGLLLAAAMLRSTLFSSTAPRRGDMTTLNFLNGGLADAWLGADDTCEQKCQVRFATEVSVNSRTRTSS